MRPVPGTLHFRHATAEDAAACAAIYRPHVENATTSFEAAAPDADEMRDRIARAQARHAWLVAEDQDGILGYAYAGLHREREAYRYTAEVSAYIASRAQGQRVGRALYERLFEVLIDRGYCNALAGITLPNPASVAFHERLGFRRLGVFHGVGHKLGEWRDTAWYERRLVEGPPRVERPGE